MARALALWACACSIFAAALPIASAWAGWTDTLPVFHSHAALEADRDWHSYLSVVYGATTSFSFPIDIRNFTFFYEPLLPAAARASLADFPPASGSVPKYGDYFRGVRPIILLSCVQRRMSNSIGFLCPALDTGNRCNWTASAVCDHDPPHGYKSAVTSAPSV
eukprot:SAG31_NODE_4246_length_3420_cov_3.037338_3_plen_163_part_00